MRIGINLGPTGNWPDILAAAQQADQLGFEALSFLDHFHADKLEWPYISGWALYGALSMKTERIKLVPMVIDRLNYLPGVLAKESSVLSILSNGRFELGIGAGDYFQEARAWGLAIPEVQERIDGLKETILALREVWAGQKVTFTGQYLHLLDAACTPVPVAPMRVVVGVGNSRRLIQSAVDYADELNVYANEDLLRFASEQIATSGRHVSLSAYVWDWPEQLTQKLPIWEAIGVERTFLTVWDFKQLPEIAQWMT
ncbi:LLM class F420-dependent oxidoreductase [Dictyobacter alpinus]|uniref:LLM class F420-dependent oxidoreductase n=1 Tax=Dictyobacter alpinus TaxID=2014873 RepID=A0A402BG20_9CHLR|nr:LLM class flavin-dependent oxidoreductase [Dictyobacter alpinus]GCE30301.1 LLM class F420-dependent oxidoreductase [Dictyobacter alpinus]GCE30333.1 LLM class F420-dependent oxidoreductase [Dictyobacter alpinus]